MRGFFVGVAATLFVLLATNDFLKGDHSALLSEFYGLSTGLFIAAVWGRE